MKELFEQQIITIDRQSSKGNQLKWRDGDLWYKADYTGYEGLTECVVSHLLQKSDLQKEEFVCYETEQIQYKKQVMNGCRCENFLKTGRKLITLERLFKNTYGESLYQSVFRISDIKERLRFLVEQTERMTGLKDFGIYMCKLFTIDAFFLNEDRHTHNIAVLMDERGNFHLCPVFDNGAALCSDTALDYPMGEDTHVLMDSVKAKTICEDFDKQLDAAEELYGQTLRFNFKEKDIRDILNNDTFYPQDIKKRVLEIVCAQRKRYAYLFS